jgi:hypothetical protein
MEKEEEAVFELKPSRGSDRCSKSGTSPEKK